MDISEAKDVIYNENCLEVLKRLGDNSIDAIVTDPPYGLEFMGKEWDKFGASKGDIGKRWGKNGKTIPSNRVKFHKGINGSLSYQQFCYQWAMECLRVIKPGGNLLSFGGTRTYHRMVCAIEDAGFEIRDCIAWVYGQGFPKSLDISKAIDKAKGVEREKVRIPITPHSTAGKGSSNEIDERPWLTKAREVGYNESDSNKPATPEAKLWEGYGTGLKPAYESICLARKPISEKTIAENCLKWGVGGLNIDGCRVGIDGGGTHCNNRDANGKCLGHPDRSGTAFGLTYHTDEVTILQGRFPANFLHDGSQEVMELFPESKSTGGHGEASRNWRGDGHTVGRGLAQATGGFGDKGSAARFFYCAKSSRSERNKGCEELYWRKSNGDYIQIGLVEYEALGIEEDRIEIETGKRPSLRAWGNIHTTVKPLVLMEYLVKLVTRSGHVVLDPFIGSGTTAMACVKLGRHYIGCELDKGYYDIAIKRIARVDI